MKPKTRNRIRGSISLLLVIILLPMMTFSGLVVDMSRINMAKSMVSSAGDLTMNSALANYDTILKDVYGLFAMTQQEDFENGNLERELENYFQKTLVGYGVVEEKDAKDYVESLIGDFGELINMVVNGQLSQGIQPGAQPAVQDTRSNFLEMEIVDKSFSVNKLEASSLAKPDILRKHIVEYSKYRAPIGFGLSFLDSLKAFQTVDDQNDVVESQVVAQESSQHVTQACQKLINLIREYDKLVESINSGDKAVKGKENSKDGIVVPIIDDETNPTNAYHLQVDKYRTNWGENYSIINKYNMIFFANAPGIDSVYLKDLNYSSSQFYIKTDGSGIVYNGSGISLNPTLGQNTDAAEQQMRTQLALLNNEGGSEYTTASAYTANSGGFLDSTQLNWNYTAFSDENVAFDNFISFEKFLLNQSDAVNYSQVKNALEQIYILGKYFDNYYTYKTADVNAAQQAMNTAVGNLRASDNTRGTAINNITGRLNTIRNMANALVNPEEEEDAVDYSMLSGDVYSRVSSYLSGTPGLPGYKTVDGYSHYNFDGWLSSNFQIDGENKYLRTFRDVCSSMSGNAVANAASGFLNSGNGNFRSYMSGQLGDKFDAEDNLYRILNFLYDASNQIGNFSNWISQYNGTISNYAYLQSEVSRTTQIYNQEVRERTDMQTGYKTTLNTYQRFAKMYQADVYYYSRYLETAKNIIKTNAEPISAQFTKIKTNIKSLIDKLTDIESQMTKARDAIETYNNNVDAWQEKNKEYVTNNESDTFSKQNEASIENAKNEYNLDSFDTLKDYVTAIKKEYQDFYDILVDGTHYKYGTAKIDTIKSATETAAAVASIKSSLPAVVDLTKALEMFSTLYPEYTTPSLEPGQFCFLKPRVLPIQILKYLNETFPEGTAKTSTSSGNSGSSGGETAKTESEQQYDKMKTDSKSGYKADTTDVNSGNYGYTYSNKSAKNSASTGSLPSNGNKPEETQNTEFKLTSSTDDDGNETVNASGGYKQQADTTSTLLSGLGSALTAGLENLYILNYIYENFSYNTIVQEAIVEEMDLAKLSPGTSLLDVGQKIGEIDYTDELYTNKLRTLSNYHINEKNNYLYGAEAEYILFGQPSAKTNVNLAKGSIYALRFGFNCIYAFTDSEIRNTARTIGMGVQAATMGIVPYQLVMIVVQLAITAAESAIDLKMMDYGMRVAVIKSDDTWVTKVSSFVNMAGEVVQTVASNAVESLMTKLQDGLQSVVDAGMDKMDDAIYDLTDNLQNATEKALNDVIDSAFAFALEKIEAKLNELQYIEYVDAYGNALTTLQAESDRIFEELKTSLLAELDAKFADVELASLLLPSVKKKVVEYIGDAQLYTTEAIGKLPTEGEVDPGAHIVSFMNEIKMKLISRCDYYVQMLAETVAETATNKLKDVKTEIESKIGAYTEETLDDVKEQIQQTTNDYINTVLDTKNNSTIGDSINNPSGSANNNVASMVRFGYKDYLMLFTYLKICVDDDATLMRIADLIQMNIQNNTGEFQHKKGKEFLMSNANTYVSISAKVKVDMLLLDLDIFSGLLTTEGVSLDSQFDKVSTITYQGLYGY